MREDSPLEYLRAPKVTNPEVGPRNFYEYFLHSNSISCTFGRFAHISFPKFLRWSSREAPSDLALHPRLFISAILLGNGKTNATIRTWKKLILSGDNNGLAERPSKGSEGENPDAVSGTGHQSLDLVRGCCTVYRHVLRYLPCRV